MTTSPSTANDGAARDPLGPDRPVVVIGGGIVGLSIARELRGRGVRVAVLEADEPGGGASSAALGVLSNPRPKRRTPLSNLLRAGYEAWPELARELREETGIDVGYRVCGGIALLPGRLAREEEIIAGFRASNIEAESLDRRGITEWIPGYGGSFPYALRVGAEAVVHPPSVIEALRRSCVRRGVEVVSGCGPVTLARWPWGGARPMLADGAVLPPAVFDFDPYSAAVVLAAGAWSTGSSCALPEPRPLVSPVRGQAVEIRHEAPSTVVHFPCPFDRGRQGYYFVPRTAERIWVGATVEDAGFDGVVTPAGKKELLRAASAILPAVNESAVLESWAGLRPRADRPGGPFLGPWPEIPNLWMACGHYRNGILSGPISARLLVDSMLDGRPLERAFAVSS